MQHRQMILDLMYPSATEMDLVGTLGRQSRLGLTIVSRLAAVLRLKGRRDRADRDGRAETAVHCSAQSIPLGARRR